MRLRKVGFAGLLIALLLSVSSRSHAALDERLDDKAPDVTVVKIGRQALRLRVRGQVKEYADKTGRVFAVSWHGRPKLQAVFGAHLDEFLTALRASRGRGGHLARVITPTINASMLVYGRYAQGKVVLVKSLPKGVDAHALD
jgi:Protein of unknown function (DUF2844)